MTIHLLCRPRCDLSQYIRPFRRCEIEFSCLDLIGQRDSFFACLSHFSLAQFAYNNENSICMRNNTTKIDDFDFDFDSESTEAKRNKSSSHTQKYVVHTHGCLVRSRSRSSFSLIMIFPSPFPCVFVYFSFVFTLSPICTHRFVLCCSNFTWLKRLFVCLLRFVISFVCACRWGAVVVVLVVFVVTHATLQHYATTTITSRYRHHHYHYRCRCHRRRRHYHQQQSKTNTIPLFF